MLEHEGLKIIFDDEIENNNPPSNVVDMMNYITKDENSFKAFHMICEFLIHTYPKEFLITIGLVPVNIRVGNEIPANKMN